MIRDRDREVRSLFDDHYRPLRGLAYVILGDAGAAEEVVMEAFLKVFAGWAKFREVRSQPAYLRQTVVNLCRSRIRRQRVEQRIMGTIRAAEERRGPQWDPDRNAAHVDLWEAVKDLPERQRICVVLRYLEDMSETEIAAILRCAPGTVKSLLSRARDRLRSLLTPALSESEGR